MAEVGGGFQMQPTPRESSWYHWALDSRRAIPGQSWYDEVHGEIGDICAWKTTKVGHTVQLEWSNNTNACV